jgi:hypothetical protein
MIIQEILQWMDPDRGIDLASMILNSICIASEFVNIVIPVLSIS